MGTVAPLASRGVHSPVQWIRRAATGGTVGDLIINGAKLPWSRVACSGVSSILVWMHLRLLRSPSPRIFRIETTVAAKRRYELGAQGTRRGSETRVARVLDAVYDRCLSVMTIRVRRSPFQGRIVRCRAGSPRRRLGTFRMGIVARELLGLQGRRGQHRRIWRPPSGAGGFATVGSKGLRIPRAKMILRGG